MQQALLLFIRLNNMNLGEVIKKCRKLRGLTQSQVSVSANMSESYLSLLEKNKREPSLTALESIADALKIPVSILVFLGSEQNNISELTEQQVESLISSIYRMIES